MVSRNIDHIRRRIAASAIKSGRAPEEIRLVVVGKTRPVEALRAVLACGVRDLGENRVQELLLKQAEIGETRPEARWHLVGTLQKNKVRQLIGRVDLIQSLDSEELGLEIDRRAAAAGIIQSVLVQANVSREPTKHGVDLGNLEKLVAQMSKLRHIKVEGLMTIGPLTSVAEEIKRVFARLKEEYDRLAPRYGLVWLSMGMTDDFETAIEEGSNMVRIGRAIFSPGFEEA